MPTPFDRAFGRLTSRSEQRLREVLQDFEDGRISRRRYEIGVAQVLRVSVAEATSFGDVVMAALLGTSPLGVPPKPRDPAKWVRAAGTILDFEPETVDLQASRLARISRLGRAETSAAAQDTMQVSMQANGVDRWVRKTDPDPCPLCTELADGVARPTTVRMARHEGCVCRQQPVGNGQSWGNSGWGNVNPAIRDRWVA